MSDAPVLDGWCERALREELPGLALLSTQVRWEGRSPVGRPSVQLTARLRELANAWRGRRAIAVREQAVPAAYRAFYRQVGLDPDSTRTAIEQAVLGRMIAGDFASAGLLADALTLALLDTAVPVWALDADTVRGPLGLRATREDEPIERGGGDTVIGAGRLVVADAERSLALLFDEPQRRHRATRATRSLALFAIQVPGVPRVYVEEALAIAGNTLVAAARSA